MGQQLRGLFLPLCLVLLFLKTARAQPSVDDQLVRAVGALESAFTKCGNGKFTECIANLQKDGLRVDGNLYRRVNERNEVTEILAFPFSQPTVSQLG
jgi:hypothetical protein